MHSYRKRVCTQLTTNAANKRRMYQKSRKPLKTSKMNPLTLVTYYRRSMITLTKATISYLGLTTPSETKLRQRYKDLGDAWRISNKIELEVILILCKLYCYTILKQFYSQVISTFCPPHYFFSVNFVVKALKSFWL